MAPRSPVRVIEGEVDSRGYKKVLPAKRGQTGIASEERMVQQAISYLQGRNQAGVEKMVSGMGTRGRELWNMAVNEANDRMARESSIRRKGKK